MNEQGRNATNADRLKLVDVSIRKQVAAVLATLAYYGHRPVIAAEVWRDPAKQRELYRKGRSKVTWGFHCATTPTGRPASLAADIVDCTKAWGASPEFWLCLGYAAKAQGLNWGGYFGLPAVFDKALDELAWSVTRGQSAAPSAREWERIKKGWDLAHVETANVTIRQARAGER